MLATLTAVTQASTPIRLTRAERKQAKREAKLAARAGRRARNRRWRSNALALWRPLLPLTVAAGMIWAQPQWAGRRTWLVISVLAAALVGWIILPKGRRPWRTRGADAPAGGTPRRPSIWPSWRRPRDSAAR